MITIKTKRRPRQPHQKRAPAEVTRKFSCPKCGGDHSALEHDADVARLNLQELGRLDAALVSELANAMLRDAPPEHVDGVLTALAAVRARVARESDAPLPTLARRTLIADKGATAPNNRPR